MPSSKPPVKNPPGQPRGNSGNANQNDTEERRLAGEIAKWTRRLGVFTGGLVVVTAVLAAATIWSVIVISQQLVEMKSSGAQTDKIIDTMNRQATTMQNQLNEIIDTRKAEREKDLPVVEVTNISATRLMSNGKEFGYTFDTSLANSGNSVAKDGVGWVSIKWYPTEADADKADFSRASENIGPGVKQSISAHTIRPTGPVFLTKDFIEKAEKGIGLIVMWGHEDYGDVFDASRIHHYSFCTRVVPQYINTTTGVVGFGFPLYKADCNYTQN